MVVAIYKVAYGIWNNLMTIAMTLFTTSPMNANGSVYGITYNLYCAITSISAPISVIFCGLAICKDVMATSQKQQMHKLIYDLMRYGIVLAVLVNLWEIAGAVIQITDGLTNQLGASATYTLNISSDLMMVITEATQTPNVTISLMTFGEDLKNFISAWGNWILYNALFTITAFVTLIIIIASAISILSCAYQRIIKPLVMIPFGSITVAMAAGAGEESRIAYSFVKTFIGFCLSGAFMVVFIKIGVAFSDGLVAFNLNSLNTLEKVLYISIQNAITPIIIAGLVSGTEALMARFL